MALSSSRHGFAPTVLWCMVMGALAQLFCWPQSSWGVGEARQDEDVSIFRLEVGEKAGQAYKLVYRVQAAPALFWRFKTDFDNDFVVKNKYIREHRVVGRQGNQVITENKYENGPDVYFRWLTSIDASRYLLEFRLLNPEECHQRFHYGLIQLEALPDGGTQVTQVTRFDFFGASLWAAYPWKGGMKDFLTYTARWEQETFQQWRSRLAR